MQQKFFIKCHIPKNQLKKKVIKNYFKKKKKRKISFEDDNIELDNIKLDNKFNQNIFDSGKFNTFIKTICNCFHLLQFNNKQQKFKYSDILNIYNEHFKNEQNKIKLTKTILSLFIGKPYTEYIFFKGKTYYEQIINPISREYFYYSNILTSTIYNQLPIRGNYKNMYNYILNINNKNIGTFKNYKNIINYINKIFNNLNINKQYILISLSSFKYIIIYKNINLKNIILYNKRYCIIKIFPILQINI